MDKHRFSLLLLEAGEIYFEDFSAHLQYFNENKEESNGCVKVSEIGRLKLCSKSLVFDPQDHLKPIIKILLKECSDITQFENKYNSSGAQLFPGFIPVHHSSLHNFKTSGNESNNNNILQVDCNQFIEIFEGNILAPYKFRNIHKTFVFSLNYAHINDCLPLVRQLHKASNLPLSDHNSFVSSIEQSRQSLVKFDPLWLQDNDEKIILSTTGNKITPLVTNHGRITLTTSTLYYQPFNKIELYHVLKVPLTDIKTIIKRRFLLQHVGLELFYRETHLYISVHSQEDRDQLYDSILQQPVLRLHDSQPEIMTLRWQNGSISNYEYLLYLNSLGDRSFNDLTQYPVFPWVITDYSSPQLDLSTPRTFRDLTKPIGALNLERLQKLKERYEEMTDPKFLYGSHYSAPGFILFYLVRKYPHYMLCLHNGKFDHPDRMFNNIRDVWRNVQTNMSDFKELVPEFYDVAADGDFLDNLHGIEFGYRHDGTRVSNVVLPPWAIDRKDFVYKLREALESPYVSANLNHWIDLIFGYKQSGAEALKANNVFYYLCYEGAVDLESITDPEESHAKEVQIMEFGQVPKKIFNLPHPQRHAHIIPKGISNKVQGWSDMSTKEVIAELLGHRESIAGLSLSNDSRLVASAGKDGVLKVHNTLSATRERSVPLSSLPLSSVVIIPESNTVVAASWDSTLLVYEMECGRMVESVRGHGDAISCLAWAATPCLLASGSWDCSVRLWKFSAPFVSLKPANHLIAQLDHDDKVTALSVNRSDTLLVTGTSDGDLFLWSLKTFSLVKNLPGHKSEVNAVEFSPDGMKLVSCGEDHMFKVFDLCTGSTVFSKCLVQKLMCLAWDGVTLLIGGSAGSLYLWDLLSVSLVKEFNAHSGAVTSIVVAEDGNVAITGGEDKKIKVWR